VSDGDQHYVLVDSPSGSSRKAVQISAENDTQAAISGIAAGTRVLRNVSQQ